MKIVKRINNNVVLAKDEGSTLILTGKGIGFQTNPGDPVKEALVEKRYHPEGDFSIDQMAMLLTRANEQELAVIQEIVHNFRKCTVESFNPNVTFTLLDHILFAIHRQKEGSILTNPMRWEIKKIYPKEYQVALKAVAIIREKLYADFSEEEAAFITLHFVNAQIQKDGNQSAQEHTELTNNILRIVKYSLNIEYDENLSYFQRFVTHIRYYLIRQSQETNEEISNSSMVKLAFQSYPKEKEAADNIKNYLYEQKGWIVNDMELMYLILHLGNLVAHSKKQKE